MIIDFHTHVFPKAVRDGRECYCRNDLAFNLLYQSPRAKLCGVEKLLRKMDQQGVDLSVIVGFPWKDADTFRLHNDYIIAAVKKYPDRLRGFGCFDIFHEEAAVETRRCLEAGLSGIGELAVYGSGLDGEAITHLKPIMDICLAQQRPVMLHVNEPIGHVYPGKAPVTLNQIYRLVQTFLHNEIVLAHWGGGIFLYNLLKKEVRDTLKNVYVDTAASPFLYDSGIYSITSRICGVEHILLGTDYPLIEPERYFREMKASGLSAIQIQRICGQNAMRLLRINA